MSVGMAAAPMASGATPFSSMMATGVGALQAAGAGFSAISQLAAGKAQAKSVQQQAAYQAQLADMQAGQLAAQKNIQDAQYRRKFARTRSSIVAQTAGKGFEFSGSPLAVLADVESQMLFDKAIEDYNTDVAITFAQARAASYRYTGESEARAAKTAGRAGAFSTLLKTGTDIAIRQGFGMPKPPPLKRLGTP